MKKHLVHFIAECTDCNWKTEDFMKGQRSASQHAQRYCHLVRGEEGYYVQYDGRKLTPPPQEEPVVEIKSREADNE